jgi:hypothetical protein
MEEDTLEEERGTRIMLPSTLKGRYVRGFGGKEGGFRKGSELGIGYGRGYVYS